MSSTPMSSSSLALSSPAGGGIPPCPGRKRVTDDRIWYVPKGESNTTFTICPECYFKHQSNLKDLEMRRWQLDKSRVFLGPDNGVSCDFDPNMLWDGEISVRVFNPKDGEKRSYPISSQTTAEAKANGVMHVQIPTTSHYAVEIRQWTSLPNRRFTIERMMVGEENVVLQHHLHQSKAVIDTISGGSLFFISPSDAEKKESKGSDGKESVLSSALCTQNVSNKIRIQLKIWNQQPKYDEDDTDMYSMETSAALALSVGGREAKRTATVPGHDGLTEVRAQPIQFLIQLSSTESSDERLRKNTIYFRNKLMGDYLPLVRIRTTREAEIKRLAEQLARLEQEQFASASKIAALEPQLEFYGGIPGKEKEMARSTAQSPRMKPVSSSKDSEWSFVQDVFLMSDGDS